MFLYNYHDFIWYIIMIIFAGSSTRCIFLDYRTKETAESLSTWIHEIFQEFRFSSTGSKRSRSTIFENTGGRCYEAWNLTAEDYCREILETLPYFKCCWFIVIALSKTIWRRLGASSPKSHRTSHQVRTRKTGFLDHTKQSRVRI